MSFAAPVFAWIAAGVALATVALHLLAWRRPPALLLPTARFAPEAPVRTVSRAISPADLALLALRVLLVLLVGGALAGPALASRPHGTARVVVVDRSRTGVASAVARDSALTVFRAGDALVLFDSAAREVTNPIIDSIGAPSASAERGALSAALIIAIRAAERLREGRDSVEIVIVSPFATDQLDAATASIRRMWPGVVRSIRAGSLPNDTTRVARPAIRAAPGDALASALALGGETTGGGDVRVVRDAMTSDDSAWARSGHVVVEWPSGGTPQAWPARAAADTSLAVSALAGEAESSPSGPRAAAVVAPFARAVDPPPGRVVARWHDGEPAATELALGAGCVRSVAVAIPRAGDLVLTPAFRRFVEALTSPCAAARRLVAIPDSVLARLLPMTIPQESAARVAMAAPARGGSLAAWLLGLALLAAMAELAVRRGVPNATA